MNRQDQFIPVQGKPSRHASYRGQSGHFTHLTGSAIRPRSLSRAFAQQRVVRSMGYFLVIMGICICTPASLAQSQAALRLDGTLVALTTFPQDAPKGDAEQDKANTQDSDGESAAKEDAQGDAQDPKSAVESSVRETAEQAGDAVKKLAEGDISGAAEGSWTLLVRYGVPALIALALLIVAYFIASFLARICSMPVRRRVDETLGRFIAKLVFYGIMVCAVLGVLQFFGIGVTSFAAVVAAAGFAIGLAFQGTLSNFAAGVMLLVFRPFKVGDVVNAAGLTAKIYEIDLFTTAFDTVDNRRIVVPNSQIAGGIIENISHHQERRVDVAVGVEYPASIAKTRQTLEAAAESLRDYVIEGEDRGYQVVLGDLGDSAVQWTVRFWTKSDNFWPLKEKLTEAVKNHLDEAGIGIPFPQMDVHLYRADQ